MKNETRIKRVALYRHYDDHSILLYVGISLSAIYRLSQHRLTSTWISSAVRMETMWFNTREEAKAAEKKAIQIEKPIHNVKYNKPPKPRKNIFKKGTARFNLVLPTALKDDATLYAENRGISIAEFFKDAAKEKLWREVQSQQSSHPMD
jgi:hypothetical protein